MTTRDPWKILVVDDDKEVHAVTEMVLQDLNFLDREIDIIKAFTASEGMRIMQERSDVALILLDVVMETEHAGLQLVRYVRNDLGNKTVRIMLRTGQAGAAPEESVILEYDINDYREKTELDSRKLVTSVVASLRSFNDLMRIRSMNEDLELKVAERTAELEAANRKLTASIRTLKEDHQAGGMMQYRLLPRREQTFGDCEFSRYLLPSMYLSGDFVDYFELRDGMVGFYLADVSGHGTSSAFVTVILKNIIDTRIEQFLTNDDRMIMDPAALLMHINNELLRDDLGKYITIFFGLLDTRSGTVRYANCGHNPLPLIKSRSGSVSFFGESDCPLGMFGEVGVENRSLDLGKGETLMLISDGILEVLGGDSMKQRKELLRRSLETREASISGLIAGFRLEEIEELPDDITFLMIQRGRK